MSSQNRTIGSLLKALRARNGWTLKEMSERCGIPLSTLSKVEHDRLSLTYDKLQLLSQRLNMRMSEILADHDDAQEPAVTARRSIGRIADAVRINTANYDYYYLCAELRRKRMIPTLTKVRAKHISEFGDLVRHSGEEFVYVISGTIALHTEFYDTVTLKAGESAYIDSSMGHAYIAADGCEEALILGVCSSADEQLLESLLTLHEEEVAEVKPVRKQPAPVKARSRRKPAAA